MPKLRHVIHYADFQSDSRRRHSGLARDASLFDHASSRAGAGLKMADSPAAEHCVVLIRVGREGGQKLEMPSWQARPKGQRPRSASCDRISAVPRIR